MNYTHGEMLDLTGMSVKVDYDDGTDSTVLPADFANYGINANPAHGTVLSRTLHDGKPVAVSCGDFSQNTATLTIGKAGDNTGIQNNFSTASISLTALPNPTVGELKIEKAGQIIENEKIEVFNLNGKLVLLPNTNPFNVSALPEGIYVVRVNGETVKVVKK